MHESNAAKRVREYSNEYGRLVLKPVTDVMPVRDVRVDNIPQNARFDLETAEMIALISENHGLQLCVKSAENIGVVVHETPSTCWVARVQVIEYAGNRPADEIEKQLRS